MSDLRFLIVNNHLPHSVAEKGKLDERVSFPVYQDSEERAVWRLMQGGKDDVFIYDRCGRLAYFIPFPLSIMNTEDALVPTAILATYFQSPCGSTCDDAGAVTTADAPLGGDNSADAPDFTTPLYPSLVEEEVSNSTLPDFHEDYLSSLEDEDVDFDVGHGTHNDLSFVLDNGDNDTVVNATLDEAAQATGDNSTRSNDISMLFVESSASNDTDLENGTYSTITTTTTTQAPPKKKSARCADADMSVCRTWSKRKLLRAQTCCNSGVHTTALSESCRNYGKKRCKKIRTVLKCCLKTSYSEQPDDVTTKVDDVRVNGTVDDVQANSTINDVRVNSTDVRVDARASPGDIRTEGHSSPDDVRAESHSSPDDVTIEVTTAIDYAVCCKEIEGQRTCRVSLEGACEADETVSSAGPSLQTN